MSAALGPIHYWLYSKIQLQESLIRRIVETAEENGWSELDTDGLKEASVNNEVHPLEDLIDVSNIHGLLQDRIHDAERRYAVLRGKVIAGMLSKSGLTFETVSPDSFVIHS